MKTLCRKRKCFSNCISKVHLFLKQCCARSSSDQIRDGGMVLVKKDSNNKLDIFLEKLFDFFIIGICREMTRLLLTMKAHSIKSRTLFLIQ